MVISLYISCFLETSFCSNLGFFLKIKKKKQEYFVEFMFQVEFRKNETAGSWSDERDADIFIFFTLLFRRLKFTKKKC